MTQELHKMVKKVARRYKARCWWADEADLVQEGWVAVMRARRTWSAEKAADPTKGCAFAGYAERAVALTMRDWLWRHSAPVTGPKGRGERLAGLTRAPMEALSVHTTPAPDMGRAEWWQTLNEHLASVLCESDPDGVAERVLLDGVTSTEAAATSGVTASEVRRRVREAKKRLATSEVLRSLLQT